MKNLFFFLLAGLIALAALPAQAQLIYTGTDLTENFNGLPTSSATVANPATLGQSNAISGTGFVGEIVSGTGSNLQIIADNGSSNQGDLHSYGAAGATDRALGTVASGTVIPAFGVAIVNNTGAALSSFTLTFDQEI